MQHNPSYGSLPNINPLEKRNDMSNAAYISSSGTITLGSAKPLDDANTSVETDNVRNDNPVDN